MQQAKRFARNTFGFVLLALGVIMIFTPGPGWLVIVLALAILAAEFAWARRLLDRMKEQGQRVRNFVTQRADRSSTVAPTAPSPAAPTAPDPPQLTANHCV